MSELVERLKNGYHSYISYVQEGKRLSKLSRDKLTEIKNEMSRTKNTLHNINRLANAEKKSSELEDIVIETTLEKKTEKKWKEYQWALGQYQVV